MVGDLVVREALVPGAVVVAILLSNYAMAGLPNVKLFDLLVFVAGYTLGFRRGATVAVAAWLVYGQLNPWGATHSMLLATVMGSEVAYAAAGALAHRWLKPEDVRLRPSAGMVVLVVKNRQIRLGHAVQGLGNMGGGLEFLDHRPEPVDRRQMLAPLEIVASDLHLLAGQVVPGQFDLQSPVAGIFAGGKTFCELGQGGERQLGHFLVATDIGNLLVK